MSDQVRVGKAALEKSVDDLMTKAEDCFNRAKVGHAEADSQHVIADSQHLHAEKLDVSADHLETMGHGLIGDALEIKGEIEVAKLRNTQTLSGSAIASAPGSPNGRKSA